MRKMRVHLLLLAVMMFVASCASSIDYRALDAQLSSGNCEAAKSFMVGAEKGYRDKDRLLFLMDAGMVFLECGDYAQSSQYFEEANNLAEELYTSSISSTAGSLVTNDYMVAYDGADYEKVMINLFSSISYALAGNMESAMVEARRINVKLTELNDKYEEKNKYGEDAFARYLTAMFAEAENVNDRQNIDDAFIDMNKAAMTFSGAYVSNYGLGAPKAFYEDYLRIADAAGRKDEVKDKGGVSKYPKFSDTKKLGRVVMIQFVGKAPFKVEDSVAAVLPNGTPIKVAFPRYDDTSLNQSFTCGNAQMVVTPAAGGNSFMEQAQLAENLRAIAGKDFEDKKGRVIAKTIARAVAKQVAAQAISDRNAYAGLAAKVFAFATERADLRSWRTLPGEIHIARAFVPAGTYRVTANTCVGEAVLADSIDVKPGKTNFVLLNTMPRM